MQKGSSVGFTLIELLVVVAILGILLAAVVPRFVNARNTAHNSAAEAYAHNVAVWLASAETSSKSLVVGSLTGSCLRPELRKEGAPEAFPKSVALCAVDYTDDLYTVTVTSITGKGGPLNNGVFTATY